MVLFWAWRPFGWRWLVHKQQNMPKYVITIIVMAHISRIYKLNRPQLNQVEGFTDSYEVNLKMQGNQLLDDRKIVILASRKWNMNKDKTEAEEYFAREGYKPRASNQYMILSDSLGH